MKKIPLAHGKFALVDDEDYDSLMQWNWQFLKSGYAHRCDKNAKTLYMHREIMKTSLDLVVDHIDGDKLNNQKGNLRNVTRSQNNMNQRKTRGNSKYKGVCWDKTNKKWTAYIKKNGVRKTLGCYEDEKAAAKKYNAAALEIHGEYASLNNIEAAA